MRDALRLERGVKCTVSEGRKYRTRQRGEILQCVRGQGSRHFTAAEIADALRGSGSAVGISTIYRLLDSMVETGEIRRYFIDGSTAACYQLPQEQGMDGGEGCRHHFHLKCLTCGRLLHVDCDRIEALTGHIAQQHGFTVDHSKTVLYGECADCTEKKRTGT